MAAGSAHLRVVHTQLLIRGGARTPLRPVEPEAFWRGTLPTEFLLQRLRRDGGATAMGARRRRSLPASADDVGANAAELWSQLTTRGADEARAVGARLERWLADRSDAVHDDADDEEKGGEEASLAQAPSSRQSRLRASAPVAAVATPDARAVMTARAVLSGLALPQGLRVPVDTAAGARLRVGISATTGSDGSSAARFVADAGADFSAQEDAAARQDAALDLVELLERGGGGRLDVAGMRAMLENAGWPQLLDVAECAATFGLLPRGELAPTTRRAIFGTPVRAARALVADDALAAEAVGPLLRTLLSPSVRAARGFSRERVRISVLPGFSMLCWAAALGLDKALVWPSPGMDYLVETMVNDDTSESFLRIWQFRDAWEIRPVWHEGKGPVCLDQLQAELRSLLVPKAELPQPGSHGGTESGVTAAAAV